MATHGPKHAEPSIDIETPAGRARLDAVIALARMPDQPSPPASATASAATGASDDKARCGEDQLPVYQDLVPEADGALHPAMPVPDPDGVVRRLPGEIKPPGVGFTGAMARIDAALRTSADPFDRAMADWLDLDQITPPAARLDALVQDALAVSDPRVYGLAYQACNPRFGGWPTGEPPAAAAVCGRLSAADWASLDPGNAQPWLFALYRADKAGDVAAQRQALQGLAGASRLDIHSFAGPAAVARVQLPTDADLTAQSMAAMRAEAVSATPFQALTQRCRDRAGGDAEMAATCGHVAEILFNHSDSFLSRAIGGSIHAQLTGDPSWLDRAHRDIRVASERGIYTPPATSDASPCADVRQLLHHFVRLDEVGEIAMAREERHAASAP